MTDQKTIEQWADEYTSSTYFHLEYSTTGNTARECNKSYLAGAAKQKELCDEREKLFMEIIHTLRTDINEFLDDCHEPQLDDERMSFIFTNIYRKTIKDARLNMHNIELQLEKLKDLK